MSRTADYYRAREVQEHEMARTSIHPAVKAAHAGMAARYGVLLQAMQEAPQPTDRLSVEQRRQRPTSSTRLFRIDESSATAL